MCEGLAAAVESISASAAFTLAQTPVLPQRPCLRLQPITDTTGIYVKGSADPEEARINFYITV